MEALSFSPPLRRQRDRCLTCFRSPLTCYCALIERFDPGVDIVILIHCREARKFIATGRISHLCLEGSRLWQGYDYTADERVNALLADPARHVAVLYPGEGSANLSSMSAPERATLIPPGKKLTLLVIDGTWTTARKTMQRSENLLGLPRICFDPPTPSRIRLRLQPRPECYTTLEAIHQVIELLGPAWGFDVASREHDKLLRTFDAMEERQIALAREKWGTGWGRSGGTRGR